MRKNTLQKNFKLLIPRFNRLYNNNKFHLFFFSNGNKIWKDSLARSNTREESGTLGGVGHGCSSVSHPTTTFTRHTCKITRPTGARRRQVSPAIHRCAVQSASGGQRRAFVRACVRACLACVHACVHACVLRSVLFSSVPFDSLAFVCREENSPLSLYPRDADPRSVSFPLREIFFFPEVRLFLARKLRLKEKRGPTPRTCRCCVWIMTRPRRKVIDSGTPRWWGEASEALVLLSHLFFSPFLYISRRFRERNFPTHTSDRSLWRGSWIRVAVGYYVNRLYGRRMREEELEISLKVIAALDRGLLYVFPFSFQPYRALLVALLRFTPSLESVSVLRISISFHARKVRKKNVRIFI